MTTEFSDISAMDFLILMDQRNSINRVNQEYNTIKLNRSSFTSYHESDNTGCLQLLRYFYCRLRTEQRYPGAHFINGYDAYDGQRRYVCIKNPSAENCEKFWELAWRRQVKTIVISQMKNEESYEYWATSEGSEIECGKFSVKTVKVIEQPRFVLTVLCVSDGANHKRQILHCKYTAWSADGDLHDPLAFLSFVCSINDMYAMLKKALPAGRKPGATLVHCEDGLSGSAVYCMLDICVTQFKHTGTLSVANTLLKMREQKYSCLNCLDDYAFCYQALHVYVLGEMGMSQSYLDERELTCQYCSPLTLCL